MPTCCPPAPPARPHCVSILLDRIVSGRPPISSVQPQPPHVSSRAGRTELRIRLEPAPFFDKENIFKKKQSSLNVSAFDLGVNQFSTFSNQLRTRVCLESIFSLYLPPPLLQGQDTLFQRPQRTRQALPWASAMPPSVATTSWVLTAHCRECDGSSQASQGYVPVCGGSFFRLCCKLNGAIAYLPERPRDHMRPDQRAGGQLAVTAMALPMAIPRAPSDWGNTLHTSFPKAFNMTLAGVFLTIMPTAASGHHASA